MWGVFRGKRVNKHHLLGSDEQNFVPQGIPTAGIGSLASQVRASELTSLSSSKELKEGCDGRVSSDIVNNDPVRTEQPLDVRLNLRTFSVVQSNIAKSCGETADSSDELRHSSISLEEKVHVDSGDKREAELEVYVESAVRGCSNESQEMRINSSDLNRQHVSSTPGAHERDSVGNESEGSSLDKMDSRKYEAALKDPGTGTQMVNESYTKLGSDGVSQVELGITAEHIAIEEVRTIEKQKTDCYGPHGDDGQTGSSIGSSLQICGVASDSLLDANGGGRALSGDDINAERYFFPVDPLAEEKVGEDGRLMQSKISGLEADHPHDISPNLELALGAETKTLGQGQGQGQKLILNLCSPEAASKGEEEEDDLSASLSLSLSFPFPDKEQTAKPMSRSEQLMPGPGGHVNTSLLLFGRQEAENRRSTVHSGRNSASASQGCDRFI